MDKPLVSIFSFNYYFKATMGAIFFLGLTGYMLYHCLLHDFMYPAKAYPTTIILCAVDYLFYYLFSKSWKRVTVTETEIIVYYFALKKKRVIPFDDVLRVTVYRSPRATGLRGGFYRRDFVIEIKDGQTVSFNEAWYENYNQLTMAIYIQRYGPGHGRERYLARH